MSFAISTLVRGITFAVAASVVVGIDIGATVQRLIDASGARLFHLDLHSRHLSTTNSSSDRTQFKGFLEEAEAVSAEATVATLSHPIRRLLSFLLEEDVGIEEAWSWVGGRGGEGYQLLDNYLVRVLAGPSAWDLPAGMIGETEFYNARIALGKFEVLLRADSLVVDLPLLGPYIGRVISARDAVEIVSEGEKTEERDTRPFLTPGPTAERIMRGNRWDLQLWDYGESLIMSRSTPQAPVKEQRQPGAGQRAVVYNSPDFHVTSLAMFSCVLTSLGFHVTAIVQESVRV